MSARLLPPATVVLVCGIVLTAAGSVALAGWAMDLPRLADWTASGLAVQPNNAFAIATFGAALLASVLGGVVSNPVPSDATRAGGWRRLARAVAAVCAAIAMATGAATLCQHVFRIDLGIDRLLMFGREWGALSVSSPGRMGPPASLCWTLLGVTLLGTVLRPGSQRGIGPGLTLCVIAIALVGLLGSIYGVDKLYTIPRLTAIAPLTTVLLLFAGAGLLAAMPWREPARTVLTDSGPAGRVARVAILPLLAVAPVIGLLPLRGEQAGWYDSATGVVVMVFALSIIPAIMLWHAGRTLSRHESALRASEGLARRIAGVAPVILYVYDLVEHRNIWGNKGMTDVLGYTRADLEAIGRGLVSRLMHPDDLPGYAGYVERLLALSDHETAELEYRMRHADGTWRWLHSRDTVFARDESGVVTQILGAATDVTRRRDAEDALRQSETTLSIAKDAAALGIHQYEPQSGTICWDARVREMWGVGPDEVISYEWFMAALHPDDRAPTQSAVEAAFDPKGPGLYNAEYRVLVPGRAVRWVAATGRVLREGGEFVRLIGTVQDVTARRESEEEARESASRLRLALEAAGQGAWSQEGVAGTPHWDDRMRQIWGLPPDAPIDYSRWLGSVHADDIQRVQDAVGLATAADGDGRYHEEYRIRRESDGAERWVEVVAQVRRGGSPGEPARWFGTAQDVTDRRKVQDELRSHRERLELLVKQRTDELEASHQRLRLAERMAAIGTLSAGLGHDMGNILMPLRVRLETLENIVEVEAARVEIEAIRSLIAYLQRLAGGLRMLAIDPSRTSAWAESTELSSWWPEAEMVMRSALPRTLSFSAKPLTRPVEVAISRAGLTQAIFNLVQNAADAMRDMSAGSVSVWFEAGDERVLIGVSDTGPGMSEDVRRRCMEPFYTTKTRGLSTGLGLALVYGVVREAGGTVELESAPGRGTTFTLHLPRVHHASKAQGLERHALVRLRGERQRAFVAAELRHLGLVVHTETPDLGVGIELAVVDDGDQPAVAGNVIRVIQGAKLADVRAAIRGAVLPQERVAAGT